MTNLKSKQIKLIINKDTLKEYNKYYFKKYPRRRKPPIERTNHPSLNVWTIMIRPQMNNEKQKWKEFGVWLVEKYGYQNMKINKCKITYIYYMPTRRRMDCDNYTPKFLNDALVESGLIIDDDSLHINPLVIYGYYDKEDPRTEIIIDILD